MKDIFCKKNKEFGEFDKVSLETVDVTGLRTDDINFTMGGHHYVYPELIPEESIFLDNQMDKDNVIATAIHEFVERTFMKFYGIGYEDAHKLSNEIELVARNFMANSLPGLDTPFVKGR